MIFNKEQSLAINTIDKNVCVVAGAGTGKTQILTHRFINIIQKAITPPEETINSILAITFTKKATGEMIIRIQEEIEKLSQVDSKYKNLINYVPFLNISTIDSFCKNIIDENNIFLGLPSDYQVIDEVEGEVILDAIISEVINRHIDDGTLKEYMISNSYFRIGDFSRSLRNSYRKIIQKGYDFDSLLNLFPNMDISENDYTLCINSLEENCQHLIKEKYATRRSKYIKEIDDGLFDLLRDASDEEFIISSLNLIKKGVHTGENVPEEYKEIIGNLINEQLKTYEHRYYKYYEKINDLLKEIDGKFKDKKIKDGTLEFGDLIYLTKKIFENPNLLKIYQDRYRYIMIDEFQDTNNTQREIFTMLASENSLLDRNNLFVVGDPKQSIYGFRGSDMTVFEKTAKDIENSNGLIIELVENYRSSKELVGFANKLFAKIMGDKYIPLNPNADVEEKKILYVDLIDEEVSESEGIAKEILRLISEGKKYEDIAILYRSGSKIKALEDSLNKYNIPYVNPKSKEFYNKREIKDLILFLKFLNAKEDSESLYGLLRSTVFMIEDFKLYDINSRKGMHLYEKLLSYEGEDEKILFAIKSLRDILSKKSQRNIYQLLREFIEVTNYYEILSLIHPTTQEIENVRKFEELVLEFTNNESFFVNEFIEYLTFASKTDPREAQVDDDSDSVSLMTIHGSKGLEFPVIIFYDSINTPNYSNSSPIEVSGVMGYGIKMESDSLIYDSVKDFNSREDREERDRLLYVCVTRAKEELIFFHEGKNKKKNIPKNSFLENLLSLEEYEYDLKNKFLEDLDLNHKTVEISTDNSETEDSKDYLSIPKKVTTSITRYISYKRCPREYFLKYKLGIKELKIEKEVEEENLEFSKPLGMDYAQYGSLVHNLIENYDESINLEDQVSRSLKTLGVSHNEKIKNTALKHLRSYAKEEVSKDKTHEFEFLLKLEEGYISGSIDLLIFDKEGIKIVDFKTNKVTDLDKLVEIYKPQLRIYSIAIESMFKEVPLSASIHFLDIDKLVEVKWDELENKKLKEELNSFLRFTTDNDSIDEYKCSEKCHKYCDFLEFCNKEKNGK